MPAPDVYEEGVVDPFADGIHASSDSFKGIPYVTDRDTVIPGDKKATFYASRRAGGLIRVGAAEVRLGDGESEIDWEQARQISLLKNRANSYPLQVDSVIEFGILDRSVNLFQDEALIDPQPGQDRVRHVHHVGFCRPNLRFGLDLGDPGRRTGRNPHLRDGRGR